LAQAQEAVQEDKADGYSHMVLGTALLTRCLADSSGAGNELGAARVCYERAKSLAIHLPDLRYNLATVDLIREEFAAALEGYSCAHAIDPTLDCTAQISRTIALLSDLQDLARHSAVHAALLQSRTPSVASVPHAPLRSAA